MSLITFEKSKDFLFMLEENEQVDLKIKIHENYSKFRHINIFDVGDLTNH